MYSYFDSMVQAVKDRVREEYMPGKYDDMAELEDVLYDDLWNDPEITDGEPNLKSRANLIGDSNAVEYIKSALREQLTTKREIAEKFLAEDWEYFDAIIRQYLLGTAIRTVVRNLDWGDRK